MPASERDYSNRTLLEKLGVRPDSHVATVGAHAGWLLDDLNAHLAKAASSSLRTTYDLIFVRIDKPGDLARIARSAEHLKPAGAMWVIHPKGRGASPNEHEVRAAGLAAGLVDNKVSAVDDTHTATRYVIPLARR